MKKTKKNILKITIIALIIICIILIQNQVMADSTGLGDLEQYAKEQPTSQRFTGMVGKIIGVVQTVGSLMSIICLIVLGIKYMMGSVEEKAEYKKTLMPYFIRSYHGTWNRKSCTSNIQNSNRYFLNYCKKCFKML